MYVRRVELCWHTVCFIVENIVKQKTDNIDFGAGIVMKKRIGDSVQKGDIIAEIYSSEQQKCQSALKLLQCAISIADNTTVSTPLILDIIS